LDLVHAETKLYLILEFLDLDLKKYMDTTHSYGIPPKLVKVTQWNEKWKQILSLFLSRGHSIFNPKDPSFNTFPPPPSPKKIPTCFFNFERAICCN